MIYDFSLTGDSELLHTKLGMDYSYRIVTELLYACKLANEQFNTDMSLNYFTQSHANEIFHTEF